MPYDLLVIDLDNTLYAADNGVFARMDERMTTFIRNVLDMPYAEADALRVRYWRQYGTTLRGLVLHHGVEPEAFLHDVHDVQVHEILNDNPALNEALHRLPGRKVIHTNGICEHAERVLDALGIRHHFDAIYDIRYNEYLPKPCVTTLNMLLAGEAVTPARTLVLDDMPDNLAVARALGAKTCWVTSAADQHDWDYKVAGVEELGGLL